ASCPERSPQPVRSALECVGMVSSRVDVDGPDGNGPPIHLGGAALRSGWHVCAFFDSHDEQYRVLRPFIKEGFASPVAWASASTASTRRRCACCRAITGQATCASSRTSSNAR